MSGAAGLQLDRRAAIVWIGALAAMLGTPYVGATQTGAAPGPGYGRDPDMMNPKTPWPRLLDAGQLATVRLIADLILPRDGSSPAASEVAVHELIDEWVSAPYPDFQADQKLIVEGIGWLDSWTKSRSGAARFAAADAGVQAMLLGEIADPASTLPTAPFYARLRRLIVGAYYTTEAGFADIGYIGNQPLAEFPKPTPEVLAALDRAYRKLGLVGRVSSNNSQAADEMPSSRRG